MTVEKRNELFNMAIKMYPDGYVFNIGEREFMIVTKMVIEEIDTGIRYFRGLDF